MDLKKLLLYGIGFFVLISIIPGLLARSNGNLYYWLIPLGIVLFLLWPRGRAWLLAFLIILLLVGWGYGELNRRASRLEGEIPQDVADWSGRVLDWAAHKLNPIDWINSALGKSTAASDENLNLCLQNFASANKLTTGCDGLKGLAYSSCMANFMDNQPPQRAKRRADKLLRL